jgi:hypothetical protein
MRVALALLALGALAAACSTLPIPGLSSISSGVPQSCGERLSEAMCNESTRCRWINDFKRDDGTYATAHCAGDEGGRLQR